MIIMFIHRHKTRRVRRKIIINSRKENRLEFSTANFFPSRLSKRDLYRRPVFGVEKKSLLYVPHQRVNPRNNRPRPADPIPGPRDK